MARPSKADAGDIPTDSIGWRVNDLLGRIGSDAATLSELLKEELGYHLSAQAISNLRTNETQNPKIETLEALAELFRRKGLAWVTPGYIRSGAGGPDPTDSGYADEDIDRFAATYQRLKSLGADEAELSSVYDVVANAYRKRFAKSLQGDPRMLDVVVKVATREKLGLGKPASATASARRKRRL